MTKELVVVGDVHGHAAKLEDLLEQVREKWPKAKVCLAGDYFDRGPENLGRATVFEAVGCGFESHSSSCTTHRTAIHCFDRRWAWIKRVLF